MNPCWQISILICRLFVVGPLVCLSFFLLIVSGTCAAAIVIQPYAPVLILDTLRKQLAPQRDRPELFNAGFIDVVSNGQVGASARLVRLQVGEQGKFSLPLSVYGGVSNTSFSTGSSSSSMLRGNEHLINQFITPLSGLLNLSVEGTWLIKPPSQITNWGILYQLGERVLTGHRLSSPGFFSVQRALHFVNSYLVTGLYFQTGAWEKTNQKNLGVCWLALRYHLCYSGKGQLRQFLPAFEGDGLYRGYSMGMGVRVNSLINLKAVYYQYQKAPEPDYLLPIYQFSFNYTVNAARS